MPGEEGESVKEEAGRRKLRWAHGGWETAEAVSRTGERLKLSPPTRISVSHYNVSSENLRSTCKNPMNEMST